MTDVKALSPIGKTQWAKWRTEQRIAFNEARASGVPFPDAVRYVNELELVEVNIAPKPEKKSVLDVLEDVAEVAIAVSGTAAATSVAAGEVKKLVRRKKK